jgi:hypothetical protein
MPPTPSRRFHLLLPSNSLLVVIAALDRVTASSPLIRQTNKKHIRNGLSPSQMSGNETDRPARLRLRKGTAGLGISRFGAVWSERVVAVALRARFVVFPCVRATVLVANRPLRSAVAAPRCANVAFLMETPAPGPKSFLARATNAVLSRRPLLRRFRTWLAVRGCRRGHTKCLPAKLLRVTSRKAKGLAQGSTLGRDSRPRATRQKCLDVIEKWRSRETAVEICSSRLAWARLRG